MNGGDREGEKATSMGTLVSHVFQDRRDRARESIDRVIVQSRLGEGERKRDLGF